MLGTRSIFFQFFLAVFFIFIINPFYSRAEMICMSDQELEGVVGSGPVNFSIVGDVTRAELNLPISTFTETNSFALGHHDNNGLPMGWDQNWTNVGLGTSAQELAVNGIYVEIIYDNISDVAARTPVSVKIGTGDATGTISALFNSFSGEIVTDSGVISGNRMNLGSRTISLNQSEAYIMLQLMGANAGYSVHFNNAITN